jgi:hypothetical protein
MLSKWLKEITNISGVEGVLLVSNSGEIIDKIGTQFERKKQEQIALHILRMNAFHARAQKQVNEIEIIWDDQRIYAMSTPLFVLIVFCGTMRNLSLLRITLSVAVAYIMEDKKSVKKLRKYSSESKPILHGGDLDQIEINFISKLQ